jgi:hypothetical protein
VTREGEHRPARPGRLVKKPTTSSRRGLTGLAIRVTIASVIGTGSADGSVPFLVLIGLALGLERILPARRRSIDMHAMQSQTLASNGPP